MIVVVLTSCSDNPNKQTLVKKASALKIADFDTFFKKFKSDSLYQVKHVNFPLKLVIVEEEDSTLTNIKKEKWKYLEFPEGKKDIYKKHQLNKAKMGIEYQVEDTGISVNYYFVYANSQWRLILVKDQSD
jgi:hypothetical protein